MRTDFIGSATVAIAGEAGLLRYDTRNAARRNAGAAFPARSTVRSVIHATQESVPGRHAPQWRRGRTHAAVGAAALPRHRAHGAAAFAVDRTAERGDRRPAVGAAGTG